MNMIKGRTGLLSCPSSLPVIFRVVHCWIHLWEYLSCCPLNSSEVLPSFSLEMLHPLLLRLLERWSCLPWASELGNVWFSLHWNKLQSHDLWLILCAPELRLLWHLKPKLSWKPGFALYFHCLTIKHSYYSKVASSGKLMSRQADHGFQLASFEFEQLLSGGRFSILLFA